jgi:hypothetical protein
MSSIKKFRYSAFIFPCCPNTSSGGGVYHGMIKESTRWSEQKNKDLFASLLPVEFVPESRFSTAGSKKATGVQSVPKNHYSTAGRKNTPIAQSCFFEIDHGRLAVCLFTNNGVFFIVLIASTWLIC